MLWGQSIIRLQYALQDLTVEETVIELATKVNASRTWSYTAPALIRLRSISFRNPFNISSEMASFPLLLFSIPSALPYTCMVIVPARVLMSLPFDHPSVMLSFLNSLSIVFAFVDRLGPPSFSIWIPSFPIKLLRCSNQRSRLKEGKDISVGNLPRRPQFTLISASISQSYPANTMIILRKYRGLVMQSTSSPTASSVKLPVCSPLPEHNRYASSINRTFPNAFSRRLMTFGPVWPTYWPMRWVAEHSMTSLVERKPMS